MQSDSTIPDPESTEAKEVFAFFGLAAYHAQVLEKGLVNMLVVLNARGLQVTAEQWDSLFRTYDSRTLGGLLYEGRKSVSIDAQTDSLLTEALSKRNWIAHQFFADHSIDLGFDEGRKKMIDSLRDVTGLFIRADGAATKIYERDAHTLGLTPERVELLVQEMKKEYQEQKQKG